MMLPFFAQTSITIALLFFAVGSVSAGERAAEATMAASMSPNVFALFAIATGLTMYRVICPRRSGSNSPEDDDRLRPA